MRRVICAVLLLFWTNGALAKPQLSIAGTMDVSADYDVVLEALKDADADATSLTLFWDLMSPHGAYAPEPDWPGIANQVYPSENLQISLMIPVIDTVADRRPQDLQLLDFSDPLVIERFEAFLTNVLTAMPDVPLTSIAIGNEVDGYLTDEDWADYTAFFRAAKAVANELRPGVPVGVGMTWTGLQATLPAQKLANEGDVWMVNHYPLNAAFGVEPVDRVFADMTEMYILSGDKPVYLLETGYPSSGCGGSEADQLRYTQNVLKFATDNPQHFPLVTLVWLHDLSQIEVRDYTNYYGIEQNCFADYLGGLGLRTRYGVDKPVFAWLRSR